jgi:hypothetical protein
MGRLAGGWGMVRQLPRYISILPQGQPASSVGLRTLFRDPWGSPGNPSLEGRAYGGMINRLRLVGADTPRLTALQRISSTSSVAPMAEMPRPAVLRGRPGSRNPGPDWVVTGQVRAL